MEFWFFFALGRDDLSLLTTIARTQPPLTMNSSSYTATASTTTTEETISMDDQMLTCTAKRTSALEPRQFCFEEQKNSGHYFRVKFQIDFYVSEILLFIL